MRFTALDFETANSFSGSICAVGLAVVEDDAIIEQKYWLVRPHANHDYFDPFNIWIHGITPDMVKDAAAWDSLYYAEILPRISGTVIAAHNAAFDMSALRHVLDVYGIEYPTTRYICTCKAARKTWADLENHKLDTVSAHLHFEFQHHNAQEDALACANILLAVQREKNVSSVDELAALLGMKIGTLCPAGYTPCSARKKK
ncbi:MAG: 3'-5' exonuclease [Eubacteriales bacterium]